MIDNLNKYIHDNISLYVCYTNLRVVCSKFKNIGRCKLLKFTNTEFRYAGCLVHSNLSYKVIEQIIQPSTSYHFKNKKQCTLAQKMLFGQDNRTPHYICCSATGISFYSMQNNITKTGTNSYKQYLNNFTNLYYNNNYYGNSTTYNNTTNYYA
jgi:hypothetical protein